MIKINTREKILDETFYIVYRHGYNATSLSMILKACDIPKGSLYHYFKSKKALVLCMLDERIAPRMDDIYALQKTDDTDEIDTIIATVLKVTQKEELIKYGCPLNRLIQEMSAVDSDFEQATNKLFIMIKEKLIALIDNSALNQEVDSASLAEFIIQSVWGALSLSPVLSSKQQYLSSIKHLIAYLKSLKSN